LLPSAIEIIKLIKKIKPQIKVMIGGPHCTLVPQKALEETQADICVQGDGENVITSIKKAIMGEVTFSEIPGIYYRENNKIREGAPLQLIQDLDSIPFPNRDPVKKYTYGKEYNPKIKKGEFTSIITSRGCPFNCKFCSRNSISMKTYRKRSAKNVLEELKEIHKEGYKYVAFVDDSFLCNKKQAHEIFDEIIKEKLDMKFIIFGVRVDAAEEELFQKMKKAGVTHIYFGLESGNQDVLDFYNKKTTLDKIRYAVNLSHRIGFFNVGSFILGAPIETKEHFERTIKFAKSLPLDSVSFLPLKYVAGSELWEEAVKQRKIPEGEYLAYADSKKKLGLFTQEEIVNYCTKANRDYYLRPKFMLRLLIKSLKNDDLGFLQSYLSLFFSNIREEINFFIKLLRMPN
jgi:anaerobic magnesium-protoporphyrin IX monomethyl ester cyclase